MPGKGYLALGSGLHASVCSHLFCFCMLNVAQSCCDGQCVQTLTRNAQQEHIRLGVAGRDRFASCYRHTGGSEVVAKDEDIQMGWYKLSNKLSNVHNGSQT